MYKSKDFVIWTVSDTPELACNNWTAVYKAKYKKNYKSSKKRGGWHLYTWNLKPTQKKENIKFNGDYLSRRVIY